MTRIVVFAYVMLALYSAQAQMSNPAATEAQSSSVGAVVEQVRAYRQANEHRIMREFTDLLAIPNVASDTANIQRNAAELIEMLQRRGFATQLLPIPGRGPVILASLPAPGAARTVIFYCHYDGQPVDAGKWIGTKPFEPALRTASIEAGGKLIRFPGPPARYQDNWRLYARSASDDKAPIIAILAALDALRARKIPLAVNLKLLLEGEEEASSPHLEETLLAHREVLGGDLLIAADGPVHQSGRLEVFFGNRGITEVRITVYGPLRPLHSGHYGNWVPNPAMRLAQLLASMKDAEGRVLIRGFYEDVAPLSERERRAIDEAPDIDAELLREFGLVQPEGGGKKLLELLNQPSLNIDGLESGWVGEQGRTIIPDTATAALDLRLVKNVKPDRQVERVVEHLRSQGYYVVDREPTREERLQHPRLAKLTHDRGYPAARTSMDLPVSQALLRVMDAVAGEKVVRLPTLGGSAPMYIFENLGLPVIGVPIVNFDNNQHSPNENLRLGNLWRGMEVFAALMAELRW